MGERGVVWGMHGRGCVWWGVAGGHACHGGHAWEGACMTGSMCGRGACVAGGIYGRGCAWQGVCMAGGGGMYAGETVTQVGSMHPTGMHSCFDFDFVFDIN